MLVMWAGVPKKNLPTLERTENKGAASSSPLILRPYSSTGVSSRGLHTTLSPRWKKTLPHAPELPSRCLQPYLVHGVAFPSRYNNCSGLLRSGSPRKAGAHCAQHRGGHCNCGTVPWHLCSTAPQGCRKVRHRGVGLRSSLLPVNCFSRRVRSLGDSLFCYSSPFLPQETQRALH